MNRNVFIGLAHFGAAGLTTLAVYVVADLSGWQGPRWLPIGVAIFFLSAPVTQWASGAHERWFG